MQADYEVYLDPEEDEVFFGSVSEKEKNIYGEVVKSAESAALCNKKKLEEEGKKFNNLLETNIQCNNNTENKKSMSLNQAEESCTTQKNFCEIFIKDPETSPKEICNSYSKSQDMNKIYSNNTSVELDHNYSTPTKHKIDKTILSTPKSVVKADKDGGFLKVLSEIALVKAEAEADKKAVEAREKDEDKENKIIPEIRVIDATPDQKNKSRSYSDLSDFGIIHTSSKKEKNVDYEKSMSTAKSKSPGKILKKKNFNLNDEENCILNNKSEENVVKNINENLSNQSINLIDFNKSPPLTKSLPEEKVIPSELLQTLDQSSKGRSESALSPEPHLILNDTKHEMLCQSKAIEIDFERSEFTTPKPLLISINRENEVLFQNDSKNAEVNDLVSRNQVFVDSSLNLKDKIQQDEIMSKSAEITNSFPEPYKIENNCDSKKEIIQTLNCPSESYEIFPLPEDLPMVTDEIHFESQEAENKSDAAKEVNHPPPDFPPVMNSNVVQCENVKGATASDKNKENFKAPPVAENNLRFSKEAKKIVELLKKSTTVDDTIQEIDVENLEDTFLFPSYDSCFEKTVSPTTASENQEPPPKKSPKIPTKPLVRAIEKLSKTVEKDTLIPGQLLSGCKTQVTSLSENKICNQKQVVKKCVKKLPLDRNETVTSEEKVKGVQTEKNGTCQAPSRIPMFGSKVTKLETNAPPKSKIAKTPTGLKARNLKFHHIESPISAYIHNKPTVLVKNVKSDTKKDILGKEWKTQASDAAKKIQEKKTEMEKAKDVPFPYVVYKSASPFIVKKHPESRLPRLVSTVRNLIGSNSPQMMKHEGRFFLKTPSKLADTNGTVLAATNEVSLIVSQTAKKTK